MMSCIKESSLHLSQTCISVTLKSKPLNCLLTLIKTSKVQLVVQVSIMKLKTKIVSLAWQLMVVLEQGLQKKMTAASIITVLWRLRQPWANNCGGASQDTRISLKQWKALQFRKWTALKECKIKSKISTKK